MKKVSLIAAVFLFGIVSYSQEIETPINHEKKNSVGVGTDIYNGLGNNINLNYRRYFSKLNLKAEFSMANHTDYSFLPDMRITQPDENSKFIAASNGNWRKEDLNLNIGLEKVFGNKKLKPFVGIDLIVGKTNFFRNMGVYRFKNELIEDYDRPSYYTERIDSALNTRDYQSHSGVVGVAGSLGLRYDLLKHFSFIFYGSLTNKYSFVMNSSDSYTSDSYKEYINTAASSNYFTSNISCNISFNYCF